MRDRRRIISKRMGRIRPWRTVSWKYLIKTPWLRVRNDRVLLPTERTPRDFLVVEGHDVVAILAHDGRGNILVVEQYRHAVRAITLDVPGGSVEPDETPIEAARRELFEETGYRPVQLRQLLSYYPDSGRKSGVKHVFLARINRRKQKASPPHEDVEIDQQWIAVSRLLKRIQHGDIREATLIVAVLFWKRFRRS